jgi:hypothetical protein
MGIVAQPAPPRFEVNAGFSCKAADAASVVIDVVCADRPLQRSAGMLRADWVKGVSYNGGV